LPDIDELERSAIKPTFKQLAAEKICMEARFIATMLLISLLASTLSAVPASGNGIKPLLYSAVVDMRCRVAFETGLMTAATTIFPATTSLLAPQIGAMQSDKTRLEQYVIQDDAQNYSRYIQETFKQHLKQNADALKAGLESLKPNDTSKGGGSGGGTGGADSGTGGSGAGGSGSGAGGGGNGTGGSGDQGSSMEEMKAAMESLQSEYKTLRDSENGCFDIKEYANLVLDYYNTALSRYGLTAQNLTGRGINASDLLNLVGNAQSQIVVPLQNGVKSSANSSQVRTILYQYCLYDGCANGTNFHMAAKFESMKLADLLAAMSPKAAEEGFGGNVTAAQLSLNAASAKIGSWGAEAATPDQLKAAWMDIMSAAKGSHDVFVALNSSAGAD
jgi:hypothetical protein